MRLALIGYGRIAGKHLEVFRALGVEFVAVCNRSEEGRRKAREEGGIGKGYAAIEKMLDEERPDGALVCASFDRIAEATEPLIQRGVPALIEKPPGASLAQLDRLIELAERQGSPVMVGLNRRHYSVVQRALEDCGGPQAITMVSVSWSENPAQLTKRFDRAQVERMIFGNSIHGLDLMTFLGGEIAQPQILTRKLGDLRWLMSLQGLSDRGVLCRFESTWDAPGRWRVELTTKNRRYTFAPLEACRILEADGTERELVPDEPDQRFKPGFHPQAEAFLEVIRTRQVPPLFDLRAARPAMQLAEALTAELTTRD